jgi:cobalt/nickel transport system ATP-binding protein
MDGSIFRLENVSYYYLKDKKSLNSISLEIKKQEKVAILGPNGAGKTTLLKVLDALLFPQEGKFYFCGEVINKDRFEDPEFNYKFRKSVVLLFQNVDAQLFLPTVKDELSFGLIQLGFKEEEIERKILQISDLFRISHLLERSPFQLSEGEKKKVALASLLIIDPEIILLDEPTNGLDPRSVREFVEIIQEFQNNGKTIITATHDLNTAIKIADKFYVMGEEKNILRVGNYEDIFLDEDFLRFANLI